MNLIFNTQTETNFIKALPIIKDSVYYAEFDKDVNYEFAFNCNTQEEANKMEMDLQSLFNANEFDFGEWYTEGEPE